MNSFVFVELEEGGGAFEVALFLGAAAGLDGAELIERLVELAREAVAVEAESGEGAMEVDDVARQRVMAVCGADEKVGFEQRDAIEAPGGVGQFADEMDFGGGFGLVFVVELAAVELVGGGVLGGQDGGLGGEAVSEGVARGTEFAGF